MAQQSRSPIANLTYVDRPEVSEVLADSVRSIVFDGSALRLEFVVARFDQSQPAKQNSGRQVTCCRLALSPGGVMELYGKLQGMMSLLEKRGVVKRGAPAEEKKAN